MDEDLLTLLHASKIFSPVPLRALRKIAPKFQKIELNAQEVLYYQGDPADSVELLVSGLLNSILTTENSEKKLVAEILPGESFGEFDALAGQPRPTTIRAEKNSTLFKLPSEIFIELCHQYPSILLNIIHPIVSRSQKLIDLISSEKFKKHIVVMPANDDVLMADFIEKFIEETRTISSIVVLNEYHPDLANADHVQFQAIIDEARNKNVKKIRQRFIYFLKSSETNLSKFCFEKADIIYVVGTDSCPISLTDYVTSCINTFREKSKIKPNLVLLYDKKTLLPQNTTDWLQLAEFGFHHHVRTYRTEDVRRFIRFIRNKAVGLVLGGGGTRGWALAGAIKALEEAGIPIDAIGGTSVGAVVGASYAITQSGDATLDQFSEVMDKARNTVSWRNLTWPAISLYNAKGITQVIEKLFGDIAIENLWIPFFCISTNIAKNAETVHNTGSLWECVRASISIPGVIPPMLINGELHFDGGLLNNLPVDVMRTRLGHRNTIIALELGANNNDMNHYCFPPILTFWQTLAIKLKLIHPEYRFPRFVDTFLRSLLAGSSFRAQQNGLLANILITLDMTGFPMLYSNKKREAKLVEIGFETTIQQIKNSRTK